MDKCADCVKGTEFLDGLGKQICIGDTVLDNERGSSGFVVNTNGALRYDVCGGHYLRFHSSLLVGDGDGTKRLTVIKKGC
jgi:hypothetical protein